MRSVRVLLLLSILLGGYSAFGQTSSDSSCRLRVSLLTAGPGKELYSMWGHTAIRVVDSSSHLDIVFNYGTFDDSDPYFYLKFTRGLMRYALSVQYFSDYLQEYQYERREVTEQVLDLSCKEKDSLVRALRNNASEENRFYNYHFDTDNCTTRAGDMILNHLSGQPMISEILGKPQPSYRDLIHEYLDRGGLIWSKFGIDILLGSHLDRKIDSRQAMAFLPDYLMKGFDNTSVNGKPLVSSKREILPAPHAENGTAWFNPMVLFSVLLVVVAFFSVYSSSGGGKLIRLFDTVFFFLLGLLGALLLTLWIIRIDNVCRNNLNLMWALPTHLVVVFAMNRKRDWVKSYFRYVFMLTMFLAVAWFFLPQKFNIATAPILLMIIVRSYFRSR